MGQFHFDPDSYLELMAAEVPGYPELQAAVVAAAASREPVRRALELGTGTGETARRVLAALPHGVALVGVDASDAMLAHARVALPGADLRVRRLQDPLPDGPFELVFTALAVHHLDAAEKADLLARVAAVLAPGGQFVLGDVVVPEDAADAVVPLGDGFDKPSPVADHLAWLADAGLRARVPWAARDLAVIAADAPGG